MDSRLPIENLRALVMEIDPGDLYRSPRTFRALARLKIAAHAFPPDAKSLAALLYRWSAEGMAVWLIQAGAWPTESVTVPPRSQSGRPLCALGAAHIPLYVNREQVLSQEGLWRDLLKNSGGHLDEHGTATLTSLRSVYLEAPLVARLSHHLESAVDTGDISKALRHVLHTEKPRMIRWRPFDVAHDQRLRVAQVITSLQIGGAEKVALDLSHALQYRNIFAPIIVTGLASRGSFPSPEVLIDVSGAFGGRSARIAAAATAALELHMDAVHAHLLSGADLAAFRDTGLPVMMTLHNMRPGWPAGTELLQPRDVSLMVACAHAVERDFAAAQTGIPVRTAWNGIDERAMQWTPRIAAAANALREQWGLGPRDIALVAIANPRPQKRLEMLPAILAALREKLAKNGGGQKAILVIAGEASVGIPEALEAEARLVSEIQRLGLQAFVHRVGIARDIAPLLHAGNVVVSPSAWEGLSLAQLEAVAAGRGVVSTGVGGAPELAALAPDVRCLPIDASPDQFVDHILQAFATRVASPFPAHFQREAMADRYAQLLPRAIETACPKRQAPEGLWLITNNFSTGGAQSSARRLLLALKSRGHRIRAAVVQEQTEFPTPGRRALQDAGISVFAVPSSEQLDPAASVRAILEAIDRDPPQTVLFWNLIAQHKVLLADLLTQARVIDVSPGEMYFSAMEKYFVAPRPGLPYLSPRQYGQRLHAIAVKYAAEAAQARDIFGTPVQIIPNGIDIPALAPHRRPRSGTLIIGTAARLSPQKKLEELFAALRLAHPRMPAYVLRVAGGPDGDNEAYAQSLRQSAADLPIEWLGDLPNIHSFLGDLDLFVMISEPAGCPNASLEAMAAGLPVIATDCGGASEQVIDNHNGRLVPRADPALLAQAILEAAHSPDRLDAWGVAGRKHAEQFFSIQRMAENYERLSFSDSTAAVSPATHVARLAESGVM